MRFIITVDTEADNQWKGGGELTLRNLTAIPRFQALCEKFSFIPTYFVTYEVAESQHAPIFQKLSAEGKAEIGGHLHPWTTPPYFGVEEEKRLMHFPSELSDDYLRKKFIALHDAIEGHLQVTPTSFRAGRWGLDGRVAKLLEEFRYEVDCSVTPFINWNYAVKARGNRVLPDFTDASPRPSMLTEHVVELPMTVLPRGSAFISRMGAKLLKRGSFAITWCRVFPDTSIHELIDLYYRTKSLRLPYIQFMTHSSELVAGGSPYTKTEEALEHLFTTMEEFFDFLKSEGVEGITATEAAKAFKRN